MRNTKTVPALSQHVLLASHLTTNNGTKETEHQNVELDASKEQAPFYDPAHCKQSLFPVGIPRGAGTD